MSMTSKVKSELQQAILTFLKPGTTATNNGLKAHVAPNVSVRSIQEATQKMTAQGLLVAERSKGKTWYGFASAVVADGPFIVEVQSIDDSFAKSYNDGLYNKEFNTLVDANKAIEEFGSTGLTYRAVPVK